MTRPIILITLTILYLPLHGFAQYDSRLSLQAANFFSPSFYYQGFTRPIKSMGTSITHNLCNNLGIKIGYQQWIDPFGSGISEPFEITVVNKKPWIDTRHNYKMLDISGVYSRKIEKHEFFGDVGISNCVGENLVITSIYQQPGYPDKLELTELRKANYFGFKYEIGYNYLLFKNRMNVGVSGSSRNYFGKDAFTQYNLNVNFGYNFNILKRKQESKES